MFVLDTNILSVMMRSPLVPEVATWVAAQPKEMLYTTAVCQALCRFSGLSMRNRGNLRAPSD